MSAILTRIALVACVLCMCHPSAVFGAVVPVNVSAVDLQSGDVAGCHVGYESNWIMPGIADLNASGAIAVKSLRFLAVATMHHGNPLSVYGVSKKTMFGNGVSLQASAALSVFAFELIYASEMREFSAVAFANSDVSVGSWSFSYGSDSQSAKLLADDEGSGGEGFKPKTFKINHGYPVINNGLIVARGVIS